ncbi:DUF4148 domain-containing protein [Bordetella sp. N]|uniref:DUF4148 domain-containing protein n=1 Tax=Bordetella sp. N TaxID=1746199 RepID=UPI0009E901B9|nr:DUF4148 domain-containing protein [Bordetella sp. N]
MKILASAVVVSLAMIAGAAQAATPLGDPDNAPFQGTYGQADEGVSRAQVQAELEQAKAAGIGMIGDVDNATFQDLVKVSEGDDSGRTEFA